MTEFDPLTPPLHLSKYATEEWMRLAPVAIQAGTLNEYSARSFEMLVEILATERTAVDASPNRADLRSHRPGRPTRAPGSVLLNREEVRENSVCRRGSDDLAAARGGAPRRCRAARGESGAGSHRL